MSFPRLPAYRISGPLSAKLRLVTLLAVTAVLWVHAYNMSSRFVTGENAAEASGAVASALRTYLPTPYAWLTGGRGGQTAGPSRGRRPGEDPAAAATDLEGEPALAETGGASEPVRRGS